MKPKTLKEVAAEASCGDVYLIKKEFQGGIFVIVDAMYVVPEVDGLRSFSPSGLDFVDFESDETADLYGPIVIDDVPPLVKGKDLNLKADEVYLLPHTTVDVWPEVNITALVSDGEGLFWPSCDMFGYWQIPDTGLHGPILLEDREDD